MMNEISNPYVKYLNGLHNYNAQNPNAYGEKNVESPYYEKTMVEMNVCQHIIKALTSFESHILVLTGHAGDGKTSLMYQVLSKLGIKPDFSTPIVEHTLATGQVCCCIKDFSELSDEKKLEMMKKIVTYPSEGKYVFMVANTGPLINTFGKLFDDENEIEQAKMQLIGAMDDNKGGITLDNFSLRGTTGLSLRRIPVETLRQFNALRPYDLIVLQYGLNVAHEEVNNYAYYVTGMRPVLDSLKQAFPQAGILVVGVGDRDYKDEEGILRTMPCIKSLLRYQQRLAADNAVAFWNLYEAMGGEASMAKLVEADPPQANLDYTHINFCGGHYIAGLLYDVLVYGKQQYDRRRAYEDGL